MDIIHTTLGSLLNDTRYYLHHTSYAKGYVSRKADYEHLPVTPYKGRFGTGYTVDLPSYESTRYCRRQYYILREGADNAILKMRDEQAIAELTDRAADTIR